MANTIAAATLQLKATGGLDKYLTGDPKTSLYTYDYKQVTRATAVTTHTGFHERVDFGKKITCVLPASADLLTDVVLYFQLPTLAIPQGSTHVGWTNAIGYALIESIELSIGDVIIDKTSGLFLEIMSYLESANRTALDLAVGRVDTPYALTNSASTIRDIHVPLQFWFTQKISLALPMEAFRTNPLKMAIQLRAFENLVIYDGETPPTRVSLREGSVLVEYRLLGHLQERELLKNPPKPLKYLMEQRKESVFSIAAYTQSQKFELTHDLCNCIKQLVFVVVTKESLDNNDYFHFGQRNTECTELVKSVSLLLDGKERFEKQPESYYRLVVPQKYSNYAGNRNIYVVTFSEYPHANQPSGTLNFSTFDSIELQLEFIKNMPESKLYVLGIAYNLLEISGSRVTVHFMS